MPETRTARIKILASMVIFGTISIVARKSALPSAVLALGRAVIGCAALMLYSSLKGNRFDFRAVCSNLKWLIPSGMLMGIDWVLLFEAYNHTSVATATLCYYMEPIFLVLVAPLLLKEKLTAKKIICTLVALGGMFLVSGVIGQKLQGSDIRGVILALGAAAIYAAVIILNKCMGEMSSLDKVSTQLAFAIPAVLVYVLVSGQFSGLTVTANSLIWLFAAGVVYTGLAYVLLYGSVSYVSSQTVAVLSYLDPAIAVLVSVFFFSEPLTLLSAIGAALILGAAIISEISPEHEQNKLPDKEK